ncbi:hypothetical protein PIB30_029567 [Stylosanthes scabra]|uniref:Uncharacterized protein n=1 Tax=Stylosanthes scabra TaxID=79078 RepID=A0ABU6X8W3_9FABA|nr:hypothetical protein [Stylosanthes scabra]
MVSLELAEETGWVSGYSPEENNLHREDDVDLIYEVREEARMRQQLAKELLAARYNKKVKSRELEEGDLVLRRADIGGKNAAQGKLGATGKAPTKWSKCSEKERTSSAQLKGQKCQELGFNEACKRSGHLGRY